jgi:hypothetical protein
MRIFIDELIDKDNKKCPKAFIGIVSGLALVGSMVYYHTDALVYSVTALSMAALGLSVAESINDRMINSKTESIIKTE